MVASTEFASFLRDELAPLGYITTRRMFGKTGVFCEGVMFGMVTENTSIFESTAKIAQPSRKLSHFLLSTT